MADLFTKSMVKKFGIFILSQDKQNSDLIIANYVPYISCFIIFYILYFIFNYRVAFFF